MNSPLVLEYFFISAFLAYIENLVYPIFWGHFSFCSVVALKTIGKIPTFLSQFHRSWFKFYQGKCSQTDNLFTLFWKSIREFRGNSSRNMTTNFEANFLWHVAHRQFCNILSGKVGKLAMILQYCMSDHLAVFF